MRGCGTNGRSIPAALADSGRESGLVTQPAQVGWTAQGDPARFRREGVAGQGGPRWADRHAAGRHREADLAWSAAGRARRTAMRAAPARSPTIPPTAMKPRLLASTADLLDRSVARGPTGVFPGPASLPLHRASTRGAASASSRGAAGVGRHGTANGTRGRRRPTRAGPLVARRRATTAGRPRVFAPAPTRMVDSAPASSAAPRPPCPLPPAGEARLSRGHRSLPGLPRPAGRRVLAAVQYRVPGSVPRRHELPGLPEPRRRRTVRGGLHPLPRPESGRGHVLLRLLRPLRARLPPRRHRPAARHPGHEAVPRGVARGLRASPTRCPRSRRAPSASPWSEPARPAWPSPASWR